ncbi:MULTISPECIES: hypothetical protein [Dietzia]|nr:MULTISPECIES: hypothetical protein [Dietzia]MBC7297433.1 hypothetical protein [Demequina sp.]MBB1039808.1 hypothetical protein [Dietzia sp. Cai40]MBB1043383.1 hypothetical protein [Dietzia sp. DQ11-44]MBB1048721.1 hypothetical protein [Dietzia cercidiphylli]MBB1058664.1 hypothetical protein [Dietzia sp. B19]
MATDTNAGARSSAAHRSAVTGSMQDIARFLIDHLGSALTAHIAGVDRRTVSRWAEGAAARASGEANLRVAFQVFQLIQTVDAPQTVRAWFMGMNPQLDDVSPAEALADGQHREVMAAARAFVAGG